DKNIRCYYVYRGEWAFWNSIEELKKSIFIKKFNKNMGTEKVVVGDPERHVIVGAIVIVVTAADPVSGYKRAVKPFDHLLVGAELLRDRIIVCESDYLGNVKLEAVSQLPYELLGGQRISTIAVGNEPKLLGESFYAPESHAHGEDAWPDRA
ncbi:hypothetical protein NE556_22675, partial [[Clostridium] symbiosum]